jgi:glutaredoxin
VRVITVYSKLDCHLCAEAMTALRGLQAELGFALEERDITTDDALHRAYFERIPVVALDGDDLFEYFVDEAVLRERLSGAAPSAGRGIL